MSEKSLYVYEGPVMQFGKVVQDSWKEGTQAVSIAKALSNLKFQYKRKAKLSPNSKIDLLPEYLKLK